MKKKTNLNLKLYFCTGTQIEKVHFGFGTGYGIISEFTGNVNIFIAYFAALAALFFNFFC